MPACFSLTNKATGEIDNLQAVDDAMREYFGAPPDSKDWYGNWYNYFGMRFATGSSYEEILEEYATDPRSVMDIHILNWLKENYTINSWYEP